MSSLPNPTMENTDQPKAPNRKKPTEPERDSEGRIKITIVGATFVPSHHMLYRIRQMIHNTYSHSIPWSTWKEYPENRKLLLFKQLKWRFTWDETLDDKVYSLWEAKANAYLQQAMTNARISGKRPTWFCVENWALVVRKWNHEEKPRPASKTKSLQEQMEELREETRGKVRQIEETVKRQQDYVQVMGNVMVEALGRQARNANMAKEGVGSQFGVSNVAMYGFPGVVTQQPSRLPGWLVAPGMADGSRHGPSLVPIPDGHNLGGGRRE